MWVSTKAQYGMRALVEVAMFGEQPISLKTISQRQFISQQYLEQIFAELRRAGIVESVRGARGGYKLARPVDQIDSLEGVELLEGSVAPVRCIDDATNCAQTGHGSTEGLWRQVYSAVRDILKGTTLADLVDQRMLVQGHPLPQFVGAEI